ncbi:MAG TPA: transporter [Thermoguttaceae bacterium]|nr:transporter [Thermoguttaceae bacterium]
MLPSFMYLPNHNFRCFLILLAAMGFPASHAWADAVWDDPPAPVTAEFSPLDLDRAILRGQKPDTFDPLEADRPDFTESPNTIDRGRLQLESGWTYFHDQTGGLEFDAHRLPELLLRYGLTEKLELRLVWSGYMSYCQHGPQPGETLLLDGVTDMDVGCKLKISKQSGWRPESALIACVTAPVGATAWTSSRVDTYLTYNYGWDITEQIFIGGSTGTWWTGYQGDHITTMYQSATLGMGLTERLGAFFEWYVLIFDGGQDNRPDHFLDTGITYLVTEDFQLDWRIGAGLSESAEDLFTGAGFAVRW